MTNKEKMLKAVLDDPKLKELYDYEESDYEDLYAALNSENVVVATAARIVNGLNGSTDDSDKKKVYMTIFNYLNENILL